MLTEREFREELRVFTEKMAENGRNWQLKEDGKYARESRLIELDDGRIVSGDTHILYNSTYQVPTLWFNFFEKNGTPISKPIVEREILRIPTTESDDSIRQRLSHYEHPYLGVLYYNVHPCQTSQLMSELKPDGSYLMTWMSVYGPQIGVQVPDFRENKGKK